MTLQDPTQPASVEPIDSHVVPAKRPLRIIELLLLAIGLAIIMTIFRARKSASVDDANLLKG